MKKNAKCRKVIAVLVIILIGITIYELYNLYINIDIYNNKYEAKRTSISTESLETVDNIYEENEDITDILENSTKSVVGISKLKEIGGSIFNNVSSDELGLGTGIIVSDNGYILSNSHVTGEKYSNCYVTIDEITYKGSVVWADSELDLSITKIQATDLKSANLGNSKDLKVGEQVYAIGNPIRFSI